VLLTLVGQSLDGMDNLLSRIAEMGERLKPTFISLTWRASFKNEDVWLKIGSTVQKKLGIDVLLHLTCHLPRKDLVRVLNKAREAGIQNILALRGDSAHITAGSSSHNNSRWRACKDGFKNAIELVHLIRAEHGDYFCVGVGGYPEVHTSCWNSPYLPPSDQSRELDLVRLKDKVDAGADFIITQFFYDVDVFGEFVRRCEEIGITVPIIPGYAPIQNYSSFEKFKSWVKPQIPQRIELGLAEIKDDDEKVQQFGVELGTRQCGALLKLGVPGLHFFTLNLAVSVASILRQLKLRDDSLMSSRELPWRGLVREREEVRPIFWAHRHSSYLSRTSTWEEYPNGRWGDSRSAATFELTDYYLAEKKTSDIDLRRIWGTPQSEEQVASIFVSYMQGKIAMLPWCDQKLADETETISQSLYWINKNGFLTINSQPKVNGVPSDNPRFGWGGAGGYCFQKAYVEFFCSPEMWFKLKKVVDTSSWRLSYHATNVAGEEYFDQGLELESKTSEVEIGEVKLRSNSIVDELVEELGDKLGKDVGRKGRVNAVTWGVFPGREIIQPTVVDTESFKVWKDEAFELWTSQWAQIYKSDKQDIGPEEENSIRVLEKIRDTWFLVNIVDNDYVSETSDIFDVFKKVILDDMSSEQLRQRVETLEAENLNLTRQLMKAMSKLEHENTKIT